MSILAPVAFALFLWWFGTGAILYLTGLPRRAAPRVFGVATLALAAALVGLVAVRDETGASGSYVAFACALVVWGWQEIGLLTGIVAGPRATACPPGAKLGMRFRCAIEALAWHELALAGCGLAVFALTFDAPNKVGAWTYAVLWTMRVSAELNLFLGARNRGESFLPDHLRYLATYFDRRPMNALFPVSVAAASLVAVPLWKAALGGLPGAADPNGLVLVATLLTLAIAEHVFMMLPLPLDALWRWGLRSRAAPAAVLADPVTQNR